ncbi:MAG: formylglycine-generating enzyme family protein [Pseudomonadota bacterium]
MCVALTAVAGPALAATAEGAAHYLALPGGAFRSVLPADGKTAWPRLAPFQMRSTPVSNAEFRDFVAAHPQWRRDQVPAVLATPDYLSAWSGALAFAPLAAKAPVTRVSWHAAAAFCTSEKARLPRWYEWEMAAAADERRADARDDPAWLAKILAWYSRPGTGDPQAIGLEAPNSYGLYDVHGLVWEWVEDFSGLFVSADSRVQGERKLLDYCGGAALSLADRRNYAVLMRLALLAAMEAEQGGANLGFRCVREPEPEGTP